MNVVKKTILNQRTDFVMILLGIYALALSFIKFEGIAVEALVFVSMVVMFAIPVILGHFSESSEDSGIELNDLLLVISAALVCLLVFASFYSKETLEKAVFIPILACGVPIIIGAIIGVVKEHDITADVLVSVAIVASVLIGEYQAAAEVAIIMQIGGFLEEATVGHANDCISMLHNMQPVTACLVKDGKEHNVSVDDLKIGDEVHVRPGETVPCDGTVISGSSSLDCSMLTGESVPRDAAVGDKVFAGTMNMYGSLMVKTDTVGSSSTISKLEKLIEEADANKSKIVRVADKWAAYIVVMAFTVAILTYIFTGEIIRSVTVLCVFCPCALILATPTAIMAAVGNMSRRGILVKDGGAVERLANVQNIVMDKTGTLTVGTVSCNEIVSKDPEVSKEELGKLMASVEAGSEHPLGKAIVNYAKEFPETSDFQYVPGKGVMGTTSGKKVVVGNRAFIKENCPDNFESVESEVSEIEANGFSVVMAGIGSKTVGYAKLSDSLKDTSKYAVRHLWMLHLKRIMLTGDSQAVATRVKDELGMDDVVWECLPSDKLRIISNIDDEAPTCMIGDGVNDAPALKRASIGISMGGIGTDLAMESSDIVFLHDDLSKLPGLIRLSKRALLTIKVGIAFSLTLNTIAMIMAVLGIIDPIAGALVHNIGSVIVIIAAACLLRYNPWKKGCHKSHKTASKTDA